MFTFTTGHSHKPDGKSSEHTAAIMVDVGALISLVSGLVALFPKAPAAAPVNADPFSGKSHGLDKPKNETPVNRDARFAAEFDRQQGYNDALHGDEYDNDYLGNPLYARGYHLGEFGRAMYIAGFNEAVNGDKQSNNDPAWSIGWTEGKKQYEADKIMVP